MVPFSLLSGTLSAFLFVWSASAARLVDFQVTQPPPVPQDAKQCSVQVLERDFANSFGQAEVVQLTPPTDCGEPGTWAAVTLNLTATSNGTQFDRLGIFTFHNVEIWRTSTPEPTRGDGIIWTYVKDVTRYMPLFAEPGTFIFQLDNLIETGLDGVYHTLVTATYYASSEENPPAETADLIVPLSTMLNDTGNDASVPPVFSINVTLPQNTVEVYAELYASGNSAEEFWYFNAANEFISDLPDGTANGQGPFREVRLLIDGLVAGTAFPYATIFTGGIVPTAWRPITSYGALDLPTYFLDVTPFVPLLTDGNAHNFSIDVVSAEDDHAILQNWFVSGLLQVVTDSSSAPTTGNITSYSAQPFAETTVSGSLGDNGDVNITVTATRNIQIEADILSGSGNLTHVAFSQSLQYTNVQSFLNNASVQNVFQTSTGLVSSTHNDTTAVSDIFSFPLAINFTNLNANGTSWKTLFDHSYDRVLVPSPFILGTTIHERQIADGFFMTASTGNSGNGTNNNTFEYADTAGNTFRRNVNAFLNNITLDEQSGSLAPAAKIIMPPVQAPESAVGPETSAKARLPGGKTIG